MPICKHDKIRCEFCGYAEYIHTKQGYAMYCDYEKRLYGGERLNIDELLKLWSEKSEPADMSGLRNDFKTVAEYSVTMVEELENAGFSRKEAIAILIGVLQANMKTGR